MNYGNVEEKHYYILLVVGFFHKKFNQSTTEWLERFLQEWYSIFAELSLFLLFCIDQTLATRINKIMNFHLMHSIKMPTSTQRHTHLLKILSYDLINLIIIFGLFLAYVEFRWVNVWCKHKQQAWISHEIWIHRSKNYPEWNCVKWYVYGVAVIYLPDFSNISVMEFIMLLA